MLSEFNRHQFNVVGLICHSPGVIVVNKLKSLYFSSGLVRFLLGVPVLLRRWLINIYRKPAFDAYDNLRAFARSDIVLHVDAFKGDFQLPPSSHLLMRLVLDGCYEPELASLTENYINPDKDFIDVGANVGFYSVLAGKILASGRVLAIEPSDAAYNRLLTNLESNQVKSKCIVVQGLAGSSNIERDLQIIDGMEEYSSVSTPSHFAVKGLTSRSERVAQYTIDSLVRQYKLTPGFIKIDVEGFEVEVLKGAIETLRLHRPIVLCEVSDVLLDRSGASARELFGLLVSCGYRLSDPLLANVPPGQRGYGDVLALPTS